MNHSCPNCGYCPHCGRSDAKPLPLNPYPYGPWWGVIPPYTTTPYYYGTWTVTSDNTWGDSGNSSFTGTI